MKLRTTMPFKMLTIIGLFSITSSSSIWAKNEEQPQDKVKQTSDTTVYRGVTKRAGQPPKWNKYVIEAMKFPEEFRKKNVSVRVTLEFVVEKNGQLSHPNAIKSVGYINGKEASTEQLKPFIDEAFRVIINSPQWEPAINNETIVRSYLTTPLEFRNR